MIKIQDKWSNKVAHFLFSKLIPLNVSYEINHKKHHDSFKTKRYKLNSSCVCIVFTFDKSPTPIYCKGKKGAINLVENKGDIFFVHL
jgi:hypothetical protein